MTVHGHSSELWTQYDRPETRELSATALSTSNENTIKNEWANIRKELLAFGSLQGNWDEQGGSVPSPELLDSVIIFLFEKETLEKYLPPVRVVPTNEGGIIIEWQFDGVYLEAEITEPYYAEWMYSEPGRPTMHWDETWGSLMQASSTTITASEYATAA